MNRLYILAIITFMVVGCSQEENSNYATIPVDIDESRIINVQSGKFEVLKLNDGSSPVLLGQIKDASFFCKDIIIEASDGVFRYDGNSGQKVTTFAGKGRARNEYISVWSHWVDSDTLKIYDMNGKKVLSYNMDGVSIASHDVSADAASSPFQLIVPYEDGYIGKRIYDGIGEAEELALYDSKYKFVKDIPTFKIRSGIKLHNPFTRFNNIVLYNRYFDNMIYEVNESGAVERYLVDFKEHNIPDAQSFDDEYDVMDYLRKKHKNSHASLISNIYESDSYLSFNYLFDGAMYLAIYDKLTGVVESFNFNGDDLSIENMRCNQDKVYIFFADEKCNYIGVGSMSDLLL